MDGTVRNPAHLTDIHSVVVDLSCIARRKRGHKGRRKKFYVCGQKSREFVWLLSGVCTPRRHFLTVTCGVPYTGLMSRGWGIRRVCAGVASGLWRSFNISEISGQGSPVCSEKAVRERGRRSGSLWSSPFSDASPYPPAGKGFGLPPRFTFWKPRNRWCALRGRLLP